jgi:hypothetical protein
LGERWVDGQPELFSASYVCTTPDSGIRVAPRVITLRAFDWERGMYGMEKTHGRSPLIKLELGLNLKELAVVFVILGTVGAIVLFSVGEVTTKASVAACYANAATVATALGEFNAAGGNPEIVTPTLLTSAPTPLLASFPSSPDYAISIVNGQVMIAAPKSSTPVPYRTAGACDRAGPSVGKIPAGAR